MNIFERLARTRPAEPTTKQPPKDPAQLLLDWLLRQKQIDHYPAPTPYPRPEGRSQSRQRTQSN